MHTNDPSHPVVLLVGHGASARDCPRELVSRLKSLEGARRARGGAVTDEERRLDAEVRNWPRTPANDPYRVGFEALGDALRARLPGVTVVTAYNELCAPSLEEALDRVLGAGSRRIFVVTSMPTPGGVHAEIEIPEALDAARSRWPDAEIVYAWPPSLDAVAALFAGELARAGLALP